MYAATVKMRYDKIDQKNVEKLVEKWSAELPSDKFLFRTYASIKKEQPIEEFEDILPDKDNSNDFEDVKINVETVEQRLLFIHQTKHQADLLIRYGNEMGLLDVTYKTTRKFSASFLPGSPNQSGLPDCCIFCHTRRDNKCNSRAITNNKAVESTVESEVLYG